MRSITPQYQNSRQQTNQFFSRDGGFKSYTNEGYRAETTLGASGTLTEGNNNSSSGVLNPKSPLSSLYQKVQREVLSNKLARAQVGNEQNRGSTPLGNSSIRKQTSVPKQAPHSSVNLMTQSGRRDETPKGANQRIALNSHYSTNAFASPEQQFEKYSAVNLSSTISKLSKKNSTKALNVVSPSKRTVPNDKAMYMSYDATQVTGLRSQTFKLDLSKNNQQQQR